MFWRSRRNQESRTVNSITGTVRGSAVNAGSVTGGIHLHEHQPTRLSLPHRAGIRPPRAFAFQDRDVLAPDTSPTTLLCGLGGVGKTQIALHHADRLWDRGDLDLIVWITSTSRDATVAGYARLAVDLLGGDDRDAERNAQRLLDWLETTSARWLVVLDDLQNPADLNGLWPSTARAGRVLVTTRRRGAALRGRDRRLIDVSVFTEEQSQAYLRVAFTGSKHLLDDIAGVADDLGGLPLALAQASAYMLDLGLSCSAYRRRFADRRRTLHSLFPDPGEGPDGYETTVATTWSLSLEYADQLAPQGVARPLLMIASLLDANGIPFDLFGTAVVAKLLTDWTGRTHDEESGRDGLACLHRLSLITLDRKAPARAVRVHALVQRATRDETPAQWRSQLPHIASGALREIWPDVERDAAFGQALRTNTDALEQVAGDEVWSCACRSVFFMAGHSRGSTGGVREAQSYFAQMCSTTSQHLGEEHPDTLEARNREAIWRGESGDAVGAVRSLVTLVADCTRVLGETHLQTLRARNNLAYWQAKAGDDHAALEGFRQLLPLQLAALEPDHHDTLVTRNNIARWLGECGDPAAAVAAFADLLPYVIRIQGADSLLTLNVRHELAYWTGENGDHATAAAALHDVLADRLRVLGTGHPLSLSTRRNLAHFRGVSGDHAGALKDLEELLVDRTRILGPDHPDTLATRTDIAYLLGETGDRRGAMDAYASVLVDQRRVLGDYHVHTLMTMENLFFRCIEVDLPRAAGTLVDILALQQASLGPEHPIVQDIRRHLDLLLREIGRQDAPA
jgi:NB-ARC domain/Tetratricopeptide repeat